MIYENEKYKVVLGDGIERETNFLVINKELDTVEAETQNLPQALTYCDQFNVIISSGLHKVWAENAVVEETLLTPESPNNESVN